MHKFCLVVALAFFATLSYAEGLESAAGTMNVPSNWTYVKLANSSFEMPLPDTYKIETVGENTLFIESDKFTYDGHTINQDYFFLFFKTIPFASNFDEFADNLCYSINGESNLKVTAASGDEFPLEYSITDEFMINDIEIIQVSTNCRGLFPIFVLSYQNRIYYFALADIGNTSNAKLYKLAIENIRPSKNEGITPAVEYLLDQGIVSGYPDGTFRPENRINRAEFTKIVVNATVEDSSSIQGSGCFPDVQNEWFAPFICTAKASGMIGGYPDGTFQPAENVNFAEAAKIVMHAFGLETGEETEAWYENDVKALEERNAIPLSIQSLDQKISRGEMAEMVYRLHAGVRDEPSREFLDL